MPSRWTSILVPASRGAEPATAATVTRVQGLPRARQVSAASSQSGAAPLMRAMLLYSALRAW